MDDSLGGGRTLRLVWEHLDTVLDIIENRHYSDAIGRRLHSSAGELLRLAGWLFFDSGNHAQAQRFWIAALHEAHSAGDRALGANVLGFMSCQAKDVEEVRAAVVLAETARVGYPGASSRVTAILDLRTAEAYANANDASRCRAAIDSAFDRLGDQPPQHGHPAWSYWLTEAQVHGQAGYCHLRLANHDAAQEHFAEALRLDGAASREGALRQALMATACASKTHPDIEQAVSLGISAIDTLSAQVQSARCVKHVVKLAEVMATHRGSVEVREFRDRARHLAITSN
jgi:hypothetical protein